MEKDEEYSNMCSLVCVRRDFVFGSIYPRRCQHSRVELGIMLGLVVHLVTYSLCKNWGLYNLFRFRDSIYLQ